MAPPMTVAQLESQLRKYSVRYEGYKTWKTHNRGNRGNGWSQLNGVMIHHTGSDAADQREYLRNGSSALPGPLCQFHIDNTGKVWIIGWGRANHAGGGDPAVLAKVVSEKYVELPRPNYHDGEKGATDGNGHFYGIEIGYAGTHGMNASQYSSLLRLCAAICNFHGWSAKSCIGHGEWSDWKWDPGYANGKMMDCNAIRNDIADVLSGKDKNADGKPDVTTPPKPPVATKPPVPARTITVNKGDTIVFPGGGKVVVQ